MSVICTYISPKTRLGFTGVYLFFFFFFIFNPKHKLWVFAEAVLTCTHNQRFEQNYQNYQIVSNKIFNFAAEKNLCILHEQVFVMAVGEIKEVGSGPIHGFTVILKAREKLHKRYY